MKVKFATWRRDSKWFLLPVPFVSQFKIGKFKVYTLGVELWNFGASIKFYPRVELRKTETGEM